MTFLAEKANAARWASARVQQIPEGLRPDLAARWAELEDALGECSSDSSRETCIADWRREVRALLAVGKASSSDNASSFGGAAGGSISFPPAAPGEPDGGSR